MAAETATAKSIENNETCVWYKLKYLTPQEIIQPKKTPTIPPVKC